ncbi:MAG: DUF4956 domain-containing protein, partial [Chloroflexi bacterium]|nr:DUF4956 domain-containing protein [Chloroflexota bacterium]
ALDALAVNLLLAIALSSLLAWYYTQYGKSLSNRSKFANILPVLTLTTVLVISVVKSSLALSLGLVGALSIVRFRTAIKEPEELIFLFIAIAVGLGLGADQRLPTLIAVIVILGYLAVRSVLMPRPQKSNLFLNVMTPDGDTTFSEINQLLLQHASAADLRRLDHSNGTLQATYLVRVPDDNGLATLMDALKGQLPGGEFSFVEQDNTLGG